MAKKNTVNQRWDSDVWKKLEDSFRVRVNNGLMDPKEFKASEMTRLLGRTDGFNQSLLELRTKPKKKKK